MGLRPQRQLRFSNFIFNYFYKYDKNLNKIGSNMKLKNSVATIFASMMIVSGLVACDKAGPAEKTGKKIDQATDSASSAISESADKTKQTIVNQENKAKVMISDSEITIKIKGSLLNEKNIDSLKVMVDTVNGVVTLSGSINNEMNRIKVIKIAESVDGVSSVNSKNLVISK
jgi:osmotically-inducible protein OsmY